MCVCVCVCVCVCTYVCPYLGVCVLVFPLLPILLLLPPLLLYHHLTPQVFALLALALVASYSFSETAPCPIVSSLNGCVGNVTFKVAYPFDSIELDYKCINSFVPIGPGNNTFVFPVSPFGISDQIQSGAEFFVTWGSASMFYCVIAVLVYILLTANKGLESIMSVLVWVVS